MFSKTCEYAIRATIEVARNSTEKKHIRLKDVSLSIAAPTAFTAKILQQLVRANVMESTRGPNGGFVMTIDQLKNVKLYHIVDAIDGDQIYSSCGLGLEKCNSKRPCPVHDKFTLIRKELKKMIKTTTIHELTEGLKKGNSYLRR